MTRIEKALCSKRGDVEKKVTKSTNRTMQKSTKSQYHLFSAVAGAGSASAVVAAVAAVRSTGRRHVSRFRFVRVGVGLLYSEVGAVGFGRGEWLLEEGYQGQMRGGAASFIYTSPLPPSSSLGKARS